MSEEIRSLKVQVFFLTGALSYTEHISIICSQIHINEPHIQSLTFGGGPNLLCFIISCFRQNLQGNHLEFFDQKYTYAQDMCSSCQKVRMHSWEFFLNSSIWIHNLKTYPHYSYINNPTNHIIFQS